MDYRASQTEPTEVIRFIPRYSIQQQYQVSNNGSFDETSVAVNGTKHNFQAKRNGAATSRVYRGKHASVGIVLAW